MKTNSASKWICEKLNNFCDLLTNLKRVKKNSNKLSNLCKKKAKSRKIELHEHADVNRNSRSQSLLSSKPNNFQLLWNFERNLIAQKLDKLSRSKYLVVFL